MTRPNKSVFMIVGVVSASMHENRLKALSSTYATVSLVQVTVAADLFSVDYSCFF
jgi:hypothetical protein